ncbi:hypothetical protein [Ruixingdingia sedimenti]|uniref:Uncharacterized protein n=1 Tax=Ruixingdingia sedimenti TaxID=3073604 RepID=A0ABU1F679_9RHOB|nr:hypothetical protein [Xinfangfangia sp. LG-4]MDR5652375.1 hypothetical protein [Xinfangfangia sp. LG-4]
MPHRPASPSPARRALGLAAALAVALAGFTAAATPARADAKDVAKVVVGLGALYMIGRALDNGHRRDHRPPPVYQPRPQPYPPHYRPPVVEPRPPVHHRGPSLPGQCEIRVGGGHPVYYNAHCLNQRGYDRRDLPQNCLRTLRLRDGDRLVYDGSCVANAGGYRRHR